MGQVKRIDSQAEIGIIVEQVEENLRNIFFEMNNLKEEPASDVYQNVDILSKRIFPFLHTSGMPEYGGQNRDHDKRYPTRREITGGLIDHDWLSNVTADQHHNAFIALEDNAGAVVLPDVDDRIRFTDDTVVNADAAGNTIAFSITQANINHGSIGGLGGDDHLQYLRTDGARALTGNMAVNALVTIDGVDLSVHSHTGADGSTQVNHGNLLGVTEDQHHNAFIALEDNANTPVVPAADNRIRFTDDGVINVDTGGVGIMTFGITQANIDHGSLGGLADQADHAYAVTIDGTRILTGDWDIGDGRTIQADMIRARDGDGLALYEDGGAGIFIKDGGDVGIGIVPTAKLHISGKTLIAGINGTIPLEVIDNTPAAAIIARARNSGNVIVFEVQNDASNNGFLTISNSAGTDNVKLNTAGSSYVMNNFGIGVNTPVAQTDIYQSSNSEPALKVVQAGTADIMNVFDDATEVFTILDGGNVGVGTDSPVDLFHIYKGNSTATPHIFAVQTIEHSDNLALQLLTPNNKNSYIMFGDPEDPNAGQILYDNSSNFMDFTVNSTDGVIRIDSSLRVGIKNTAPACQLDVDGAIASATLELTAEGPTDDLDVSGVNTIFIDTSANDVTLGGTTGGVDGQVLRVVIHDSTNTTTMEDREGTGNQDFYLHKEADEALTGPGGWHFVNHGGDHWHDVSHAKHV